MKTDVVIARDHVHFDTFVARVVTEVPIETTSYFLELYRVRPFSLVKGVSQKEYDMGVHLTNSRAESCSHLSFPLQPVRPMTPNVSEQMQVSKQHDLQNSF